MKKSFYQYSYDELKSLCTENALSPHSATLLYNWFYKKNKRIFLNHQDLSPKTKFYFENELTYSLPVISQVKESSDKTVKFLFKLESNDFIESVLIPFQNKYTLCLSSQVGCAMKCSFCFTGEQGFKRNLKVEEIVGQFLQAKKWLSDHRPNDDRILNIVFMGQGEPLHNFDVVKKSIQIFLSQHGLSIASHKITVSTSGYLPGLKRWNLEMPNVNLALSLHSPFIEKRNELIPINRIYPLEEILKVLKEIPLSEKRFLTYEYLILKDFNDSLEDAEATAKLLKDYKAIINLIPFNSYPGSKFQRPSPERVHNFKSILDKNNLITKIRTTKGDSIFAACGQLNINNPV